MPPLRQWHRGRVCLLGDAAHATPPHAGQGASLALEDALVMAKCLRDVEDVDSAFATFQSLRKARAESIIAAARRVGSRKMPGPVGGFFRDLMLPAFIRLATRQAAATYAYRVNWDQAVSPGPCE
jgi:2-polyprenyl-6-methoxyphenol hydroxylase-like FAD-dependent oxidoreductase